MNKKNPYGYKVGYRENGSRIFIRYFMTYTYKMARMCLHHYRKTPPRERETNRPLINPFWEIKPITRKEILAGIWDEIPFPYFNLFLLFWRGSFAYPSQNCSRSEELKYTSLRFVAFGLCPRLLLKIQNGE